jgi:hypothetical protein
LVKAIGFKKATSEMDVTEHPEMVSAIRGTGMRASITAKEFPTVILYDNLGRARRVPSGTGNVERCLQSDPPLYKECPLCHAEHEGPDMDNCPSLPEQSFERCPICQRKIVDDRAIVVAQARPLEQGEIRREDTLTAPQRIHMRWEDHMGVKHPDYARAYGIDVQAVRERFKTA